jgi:hypothetical protein
MKETYKCSFFGQNSAQHLRRIILDADKAATGWTTPEAPPPVQIPHTKDHGAMVVGQSRRSRKRACL